MATYNKIEAKEASNLANYIKKLFPSDKGVKSMEDSTIIDHTVSLITYKNYMGFQATFGHNALLGWLTYLTEREEYEECAKIMSYINELNQSLKSLGEDELPTKIEKPQ